MKRSALALLLLVVTACGGAGGEPATSTTTRPTTTEVTAAFPVTVTDDRGPVSIDRRPEAIVSLSPTATEMLYAVGAGSQVVAVDDQSDYPEEAPITDLSGFTPNLEAILAYEPDLVLISFDPTDNPISEALESVDVPVISLGAAPAVADVYRQIEVIGEATGHGEEAAEVNEQIRADLSDIAADSGDLANGITYYHELDPMLFTVTSSTFVGEIYSMLGMVNIADEADPDGQFGGFPKLSAEYVVTADPDIIFLADSDFGESLETLAERPGWDVIRAVQEGAVVPLDSDVASRWGPRIVDFLQAIAAGVTAVTE